MTKLSNIQIQLLTSASERPNGSLLPPAEAIGGAGARIHKTVAALLKRGFATEVEVTEKERTWREDGARKIGLAITLAGKDAIGLAPDRSATDETGANSTPSAEAPRLEAPDPSAAIAQRVDITARAGSKQSIVLNLLRQKQGVTITDLVDATGWLPHTTRAALTGFRKRGLLITKEKVDGVTRYSAIAEAQA